MPHRRSAAAATVRRRSLFAALTAGILAGAAPGIARAQGEPPMMPPPPPPPPGAAGRRMGGGGIADWRRMLIEADEALRSGRRSVAGDRLERAETALLNLAQRRPDRPAVQRALRIVGEARGLLAHGDLRGASARIQPLVAPRRQGSGGGF